MDQAELDGLWDFGDPAGSEQAFRRALDNPGLTAPARAELQTQLARALGLQGKFDEAEAILDGIPQLQCSRPNPMGIGAGPAPKLFRIS